MIMMNKVWVIALCMTLCVVAATATRTIGFPSEHVRELQKEDLDYYGNDDEYDPWEDDTPIYYEFEDGWYEGKITGYDAATGTYETTWEDGDVEYYDDTSVVDEMVYNYSHMIRDHGDENCDDDAWPDGTDIWVFEGGRGWWGQITHCQDGIYTTTWENGEVDYYPEDRDFDQMVLDAKAKKNDEDETNNFQKEEAMHDFTEQTYPVGTIVYKEFEDGWYQGEVIGFQKELYVVRWEDGEVDNYPEGDEMDQMVADAANIPGIDSQDAPPSMETYQDDNKKSGGAKFLMVLLAACVGVSIAWYLRRKNKFSAMTTTTKEMEEPEFKDEDLSSEPSALAEDHEIA